MFLLQSSECSYSEDSGLERPQQRESALIKLLHECVGNSGLSDKYCVLVMICILKVIRGLPTWLEALMTDLHSFLVTVDFDYLNDLIMSFITFTQAISHLII